MRLLQFENERDHARLLSLKEMLKMAVAEMFGADETAENINTVKYGDGLYHGLSEDDIL